MARKKCRRDRFHIKNFINVFRIETGNRGRSSAAVNVIKFEN